MRKIDMMMFDLDGTLAATGDDLVLGVNHALKTLGKKEKPAGEIIGYVGDGIIKLIERVLGEEAVGLRDEALRIFIEHYEHHLLDNTILYPNVKNILDDFKHIKKIILTNKRHKFALMVAKGLEIDGYFIDIVGADSTPFFKPDRRVVDYLLEKYDADRKNTVIIGDGANDILAAKNAGILSCAHLNGMGNRDELFKLQADYYFEDFLELRSFFRS